MGSPKTLELDFKEFSYVNERGEFHNERPGWVSPLSNYLFENFGAVSVLETYPYIIVYCEDKVPPPSERLFKIAGMVAIWLVDGKYECPEDIEMGEAGNAVDNRWISLEQDLLADLTIFVIPKTQTLSAILNEHFPDAYAPSHTQVALRYHNGPVHERELKRPNAHKDKLRDEYDGTDYWKSNGCLHPGSMMSRGENTIFTAGIQVKKQQDIRVTVPISCWDKKLDPEFRLGNYFVKQGDWDNGTKFQIITKRILNSGTQVAATDDIRKVNELFWTDSFVAGPQQLASMGKRVCKVDIKGNDLFSDPNALPMSEEYGELVQGIYATSMPPINRQPRIQEGVCGAPIIRARKEELLNRPGAGAIVLTSETGEPFDRRPSDNTPLTVLQKRLPQEETTGEVAGFMDIQYGGDRLLCFADVVDGLVDDGWSVVPVYEKRKCFENRLDVNSGPSTAKLSRNE